MYFFGLTFFSGICIFPRLGICPNSELVNGNVGVLTARIRHATVYDMKTFAGFRLAECRKSAGKSRMRLARDIEFAAGPRTITRYELDKTLPDINTALRIADALGVSIEELLTDAES